LAQMELNRRTAAESKKAEEEKRRLEEEREEKRKKKPTKKEKQAAKRAKQRAHASGKATTFDDPAGEEEAKNEAEEKQPERESAPPPPVQTGSCGGPVACGLVIPPTTLAQMELNRRTAAESKKAEEEKRRLEEEREEKRKKKPTKKEKQAARRAKQRAHASGKAAMVDYPACDEEKMRSAVESDADIHFSVDLLNASQTLIRAIAEFGDRTELHSERRLQQSLGRYQTFLALYCREASANGEEAACELVPPIDVAHAWRAHAIRPVKYREDCQRLFGRQVAPSVLFSVLFTTTEDSNDTAEQNVKREAAMCLTQEKWEAMTADEEMRDIPFLPTADTATDLESAGISISVAHLQEDIKWWKSFQEHCGEEYTADKVAFLHKREERYKTFLRSGAARMLALSSTTAQPVDFTGPPVDVDLFWHCHMMFPDEYDKDLNSQLGCLFYHRPAADPDDQ